MKTLAAGIAAIAIAVIAVACGGEDERSSSEYAGEGANAAAKVFTQERNDSKLPQGGGARYEPYGIRSETVRELEINGEQAGRGIKARFCMVFQYTAVLTTATEHNRVYVAELDDNGWTVSVVNPDGDCEGVA